MTTRNFSKRRPGDAEFYGKTDWARAIGLGALRDDICDAYDWLKTCRPSEFFQYRDEYREIKTIFSGLGRVALFPFSFKKSRYDDPRVIARELGTPLVKPPIKQAPDTARIKPTRPPDNPKSVRLSGRNARDFSYQIIDIVREARREQNASHETTACAQPLRRLSRLRRGLENVGSQARRIVNIFTSKP